MACIRTFYHSSTYHNICTSIKTCISLDEIRYTFSDYVIVVVVVIIIVAVVVVVVVVVVVIIAAVFLVIVDVIKVVCSFMLLLKYLSL